MRRMLRQKLKTLFRAKPQRPQRTTKTKGVIVLIQDVQAFLCALCGFARDAFWLFYFASGLFGSGSYDKENLGGR
jgi:hypothetical protein